MQRMPELTCELLRLGLKWETANLLSPSQAERILATTELRLAELEPQLSVLRARQDEIAYGGAMNRAPFGLHAQLMRPRTQRLFVTCSHLRVRAPSSPPC